MSVTKVNGPLTPIPGSRGVNFDGQSGQWGADGKFTPDSGGIPSSSINVNTAASTNPPSPSSTASSDGQRELPCPHCTGEILVTKVSKTLGYVGGILQRAFSIKIPTGVIQYLQDNSPVSKSSVLKTPCKACNGKKTIKDPSDQSAKEKQVAANHAASAPDITKLEKKLGSTTGGSGNRYTVIAGHELLEVGLGMNDAPSYNVIKGGKTRHKRLVPHASIDLKKGAPMFSEGAPANHVQGINSVASPGGHYMIKCSNKFSVVTGTQGVDITSGGPVNITGGITTITGPEITIGTQTGTLTLEGEFIQLNGKSIEVAPSDGDLHVKGTISNTGNIRVGGHTHSQSISFVHGSCVGTKRSTDEAAPSELYTGPAFWGGAGVEGIVSSVKDIIGFAIANASDPVGIQGMMGPRFSQGMSDKAFNISYSARPWETLPQGTGYILPGTRVLLNLTSTSFSNFSGPANEAGSVSGGAASFGGQMLATVAAPIILNNFPHNHALPDLKHSHSIRLPDIDDTADTSEALLAKQTGVEEAGPLQKQVGSKELVNLLFQSTVGNAFAAAQLLLFGSSVFKSKK
jgi:hypothetical protein